MDDAVPPNCAQFVAVIPEIPLRVLKRAANMLLVM